MSESTTGVLGIVAIVVAFFWFIAYMNERDKAHTERQTDKYCQTAIECTNIIFGGDNDTER